MQNLTKALRGKLIQIGGEKFETITINYYTSKKSKVIRKIPQVNESNDEAVEKLINLQMEEKKEKLKYNQKWKDENPEKAQYLFEYGQYKRYFMK